MCAALRLPDAPAGQVVLDAHRAGGHAALASGVDQARPTDVVPDAALPPHAAACLATWRQPAGWTGPQLIARLAWFETSGYVMRWVQFPPGEQEQPWWMDLLRPIM
jgi:hypothetical protein